MGETEPPHLRQAAAGRQNHHQHAWPLSVRNYYVPNVGSLRAECLWCYQTRISVYLDSVSTSLQTQGFTLSYVNIWLKRAGKGKTGAKKAGETSANKNISQSKLACSENWGCFLYKTKGKKEKERKGGIVYLLTTFFLISRKSEDTKNLHNILKDNKNFLLIQTISRKCQSWATGAWLI